MLGKLIINLYWLEHRKICCFPFLHARANNTMARLKAFQS